jgi:phage terminase Nu1 subunit (DNA packaging protein)
MPDRSDPVIVNTSQLAAMLAIGERRVQQLREEGLPRVIRGKWDLMAVIPWYLEHVEKHANPRDKSTEEAQRRYYQARAGLTEHKEAKEKGQALSIAEHKAIVSEMGADLAGALESFPVREYTRPDDRAAAETVVRHLREHLAKSAARAGMVGRSRDHVEAAEPAADEEREPMGGEPSDAATA